MIIDNTVPAAKHLSLSEQQRVLTALQKARGALLENISKLHLDAALPADAPAAQPDSLTFISSNKVPPVRSLIPGVEGTLNPSPTLDPRGTSWFMDKRGRGRGGIYLNRCPVFYWFYFFKIKKMGRYRTGLCCFSRLSLHFVISPFPCKSSHIQSFLFKSSETHIFMMNVYFPLLGLWSWTAGRRRKTLLILCQQYTPRSPFLSPAISIRD